MKKIINFIKNKKIYFVNIAIILTIFFISLYIMDIYPFGQYSFTYSDAKTQYQPMLYNFIEKLRSGILENYSFNNGFGNPTIFNYIYYLSSPINFLGILFKSPNTMYFALTTIRIIIGTIIITFYIRKKTNNNFIATLGSIAYIFSGWFINYFTFSIWLDIFFVFPLFQYSLENLMEKGKCKLYIILIAFILISNFYLGFMICLYTLVYFIFNTITKKESFKYKKISFELITLSTIIALLLSFCHLYTIYDSFSKIKIIKKYNYDLIIPSIKLFLSSILNGSTLFIISPGEESAPNICTSILFTISFFYYFINNKIILKEKIKSIIVCLFFIFITFSPLADYIINAFHVPIGFPYRYSFVLSFWIIYLTFKNYKTFDEKTDKKIYIICIALLIYNFTLNLLNVTVDKIFFLNTAFILIYTILFIFYNKTKIYKFILLLMICIETVCAFSMNIPQIISTNYKTETFEIMKYRVKTTKDTHLNQNLYTNHNNTSLFTSMSYKPLLLNLIWLDTGSDSSNHAIAYDTSTIYDMFFNIKTTKPYYLEKIFAVNKDFKSINIAEGKIVYNEMIEKATTYKNALEKITYNYDSNIVTITVPEDGYYRINPNTECFVAIKYNKKTLRFEYKESYTAPETLYLKKDTQIIVSKIKEKDIEPVLLYKENEEIIKKAHEKLAKNQINYTHYSDSHMEGTITVNKEQIIYTSIPYDKDWEILIDGKKTQQFKILGEFMGIECEEGTHTISLKYKTHYELPIIISIGTAIAMIIHEIIKRKKQKDTSLA